MKLNENKFPKIINNINDVVDILNRLKILEDCTTENSLFYFDFVKNVLCEMLNNLDEEKCRVLELIIEQITLLNTAVECYHYSATFSVFWDIIFNFSTCL